VPFKKDREGILSVKQLKKRTNESVPEFEARKKAYEAAEQAKVEENIEKNKRKSEAWQRATTITVRFIPTHGDNFVAEMLEVPRIGEFIARPIRGVKDSFRVMRVEHILMPCFHHGVVTEEEYGSMATVWVDRMGPYPRER
jgi:UDP-N-acetylglucosamine pyrophosphorylase